MKTQIATCIGPRMFELVHAIDEAGGALPSMLAGAEAVGPHGSRRYGYDIVHRAIRAGLVRVDALHYAASRTGRGALVLTERGAALVALTFLPLDAAAIYTIGAALDGTSGAPWAGRRAVAAAVAAARAAEVHP